MATACPIPPLAPVTNTYFFNYITLSFSKAHTPLTLLSPVLLFGATNLSLSASISSSCATNLFLSASISSLAPLISFYPPVFHSLAPLTKYYPPVNPHNTTSHPSNAKEAPGYDASSPTFVSGPLGIPKIVPLKSLQKLTFVSPAGLFFRALVQRQINSYH